MSFTSEEIKHLLKNAKNSLKEKQYNEALKGLTSVIKQDSRNFNAYLYCAQAFLGLEDEGKAVKAIRKAIEIKPDQIMPWLMLCKIFEDKSSTLETYTVLIEVYSQLLKLEENEAKWLEYVKQVDSHTCKRNDQATFISMLKSHLQSSIEFKKNKSAEVLSDFFMLDKNYASPNLDIFQEAFQISIFNLNEDREKRFKKIGTLLTILFKQKKYQGLVACCETVLQTYDGNVIALEWMCKSIIAHFLSNTPDSLQFTPDSASNCINTLLSSSPVSGSLCFTAHAVLLITAGDYVRARDEYLLTAVEMKSADWQSFFVLAKVHRFLHCYAEAEKCMEQVYKRLGETSSLKTTYNMNWELADALCRQDVEDKNEQGLNLCLELLAQGSITDSQMECSLLLNIVRCSINLDKISQLEQFMNKLDVTSWEHFYARAYQLKKQNQNTEALCVLNECLQTYSDNPELWMLKAEVLNNTGSYAEAMQAHLKVASLAPHWFEPFYILGKYYQNYKQDAATAKRCFLKAFQLNPRSDSVGIALSDIYRSLGFVEENIQLLEAVTAFGAKWAKLRLGLQLMESGDYQKSINHLRSAARSDPNDSHCWEALGDGYLKRGAFSAAKKCYAKVVTLQPDTIYPKLQIARIYQALGLAEEAVDEYRTMLILFPDSLPAMKGLAESCLLLARKRLTYSGNLVKEVQDLCQAGVDAVVTSLLMNNSISCLWKLLGDILTTLCSLPRKNQVISLPCLLVDPSNTSSGSITLNTHVDIMDIALNAYKKALSIAQSLNVGVKLQARLVYCIAYAINLEASLSSLSTANQESVVTKKRAALKCAKQCVRMSPGSYTSWNLLGVIAACKQLQQYALAQHAFIKSLQIERVNPTAWSNLGSVYLTLRCLKLANDCFKEAQTIDPAYLMAWLGQATVAQSIDHPDSMKMLHHTCTLGSHHNSIVAFSYHVVHALSEADTSKHCSLNKLYAEKHAGLPLCSVQMNSLYVKHESDPACVDNIQGCLAMWNKDYHRAVHHFTRALEATCDDQGRQMIRTNLLFARLESGQYESAVSLVSEMSLPHTTSVLIALAYSYFKLGNHETSYKTYEEVLGQSSVSDHEKAEVNFVLAANCFSVGDLETAKSLLFHSLQIKVNFTPSLFALAALGILSGDLELSRAICKELEIQDNTHAHPTHLLLIKCYTAFMAENTDLIEIYINECASNVKSTSKLLTTITRLIQQLSEHTKTPAYSRIALALAYTSSNITEELGILISYLHLSLCQTRVAISQLIFFINLFPQSSGLHSLLVAARKRLEPSMLPQGSEQVNAIS